MSYKIRTNCIFCSQKLKLEYFRYDLNINMGLYCVDNDYTNDSKIPYNIYICNKCNTVQNKYLGDLNLVYLYGHNEGIGKLYASMHNNFSKLILDNKEIKNIIEIGGSVGTLSQLIISNNSNIHYTIIEPNCKLKETKQLKIFRKFVEDCNKSIFKNSDTLIMSHILEHFYEPKKVLNKLLLNTNIKDFYLCWPDLDYYIENNILNILTVEHTFYIDLDFLKDILYNVYNFNLIAKIMFKKHSVFLHFKRNNSSKSNKFIQYKNKNIKKKIDCFFNKISQTINKINRIIKNYPNNKIYLWPCSIHNLFLLKFDKLKLDKIEGFLDNSLNKINKRVYATNKLCLSFNKIINEKNNIILLNGGPFNFEVEPILKNKKYYII